MLNFLIQIIQKILHILGYNIVIKSERNNLVDEDIVDLKEKYIKHLKVVPNRDSLLKLLPKKSIIAELGVDRGVFSEKIINNITPEKLYLIDAWDSKRYNKKKFKYVKKRFSNLINAGNVIVLKGRSENELSKFSNSYFDWVYIDTDHSYLQTLRELELCRIKVKDGGIIAGHDYCQGNIQKAFEYGVVKAVNQFCIKHEWEFIYLTHETNRCLSYAIRKIS